MTRQKVAVIVWTIDSDGNKRYLLRHNKPFNGYNNEWTVAFGTVEDGESNEEAAKREIFEEYAVSDFEKIKDLNYSVENISFFAVKIKDIDIKIILNEESIGYDWMKIEKVKEVMQHDDEKKAFDLIS